MKEKRYYIAYGSNLNMKQRRMRCPRAKILGTSILEGWELLFKGSKIGSYLTIEKSDKGKVPVAIWKVTSEDEASLDCYEGYPDYYYKQEIELQYEGIRTDRPKTVTAFVYIMHEDRAIGIPTDGYMRICLEGYDNFNFDRKRLISAYIKCKEKCDWIIEK